MTPTEIFTLWYEDKNYPYYDFGFKTHGDHHTETKDISSYDYSVSVNMAKDIIAHTKAGEIGLPEVKKDE